MSRGDFHGQSSRPIKDELDKRGISVDDPSWVDEVVTDAANRTVLPLARLMVNRTDSLAWSGDVLESGIGDAFRKDIYDRAVNAGTTFAEALLAAHGEDFESMTGAAARRAKELIDRTLTWLDARPVPDGEDMPERWGEWLTLAFADADAPAHIPPTRSPSRSPSSTTSSSPEPTCRASSARSSRSRRITRAPKPAACAS